MHAQTVENIRVESEGENIKISYRIGGSSDAQLYNVTLTCSMDGGTRFEPKTVIGDVGENIRGGRSFYTVIWDVFEDVEQVGNAEFFVKVDLVSDMSPTVTKQQTQPKIQEEAPKQQEQKETDKSEPEAMYPDFEMGDQVKEELSWSAYLAYTGSGTSPVGLSFGTLKKMGVYGSFRYGSVATDVLTNIWLTFTAGLTKNLYASGKLRLHMYAGGGFTYDTIIEADWYESTYTLEAGINSVIGMLYLAVGLEYNNPKEVVDVKPYGVYPVFGVGVTF